MRNYLAAAVAASLSAGGRADHHGHGHGPAVTAEHQKCLKACADCAAACEKWFAHCGHMLAAGHKDHFPTLRLTADCGDICAVSAKLMARGGPLADTLSAACAKACDACGTAFGKHADDPVM